MTKFINIILAQMNFLVGDVHYNANKMITAIQMARDEMAGDLIVFPELALTGYPPEDLLFRPDLHLSVERELKRIMEQSTGIDVLLGYPEKTETGLYNGAAYLKNGKLVANYRKHHLPNYGVFDEKRYFIPGTEPTIVDIKGLPVGILICEDIWQQGPCASAIEKGAKAIIILNASPYDCYKFAEREMLVKKHTQKYHVPILYAQSIGGQDELVFDGGSFATDPTGNICRQAQFFEETLLDVKIQCDKSIDIIGKTQPITLSEEQHIYEALTLGVKDYVYKNGFKGALLGLSGGIDSALTLAIAVDALGARNVEVLIMPSRYTAPISIEDAIKLARNLNVQYHVISIEPSFEAFLSSLESSFQGLSADNTEENIQARCRGTLLMAFSNKLGKIVLTTGNKSEVAVGYCTLYGDMAGGFSVLKDVPKTLVYKLCHYRNQIKNDIPKRIIDRPPSAELAPNQKDEDTLPSYDDLDQILELYVEQDKSIGDIAALGFNIQTVKKVIRMVDKNEYKRRQAAPGIRITRRAFGRERRYPITSGFNHGFCDNYKS